MKTFLLRSLIPLFFSLSALAQTEKNMDTLRSRMLSQQVMQDDFNYLRKALEETHPGLYRYNTKEQLSKKMESLSALFKSEMRFYDYYRLLALLIADIRCSHTNITPSPDLNSLMTVSKKFPYWVFLAGGHVYITGVASQGDIIKPGYELLAVNGRSIDSVRQIIFQHLWMDGYNEISKERMLDENFFSVFYYFFVEQPDIFSIQCKTPEGQIIEHHAEALSMPAALNNLLQNPVNKSLLNAHAERNKLNQQRPWRVEINKDRNIALMTITGFGGGKNADEAAKKMRDFMDASMLTIKKNNISNLIIDLRLNKGGWDNQGEELFTYLVDTPVYYYRRFHTVTNSSSFLQFSSISKEELKNIKNELTPEGDGIFTVKPAYNSSLLLQEPKPNRFQGKIYFLSDGACGSTTAEFLAVAHFNKLGAIIGEECNGNYTGGNGGEFIQLTLPQTNIHVSIPLLYYENAVDEPLLKGRGTIPDYVIPYNIKDVLTGTDTQLNFTYDLIRKE